MSSNSSSATNQNLILYHICALIPVTVWGASFISTKVLLTEGLNAVEIYIYRFLLAYVLTFLVCPKPFMSNSWRDELKFLICGVCGGSIYFIAENTAVIYTLVSNVSLIVALSPLLTTLIVGVMYKDDRPSKGMIFGSVVAFLGVGCVIFNSSFVLSIKPFGDLLALLAALSWAIYSVVLRSLSAVYSTWFISRKTFFYGLITALPFLLFERGYATWSVLSQPAVYGNLLFLGIICSMAAYIFWSIAVAKLGALKSGNYIYVSPLVTLIMSAWLLGEKVSIIGYIGCALILLGLILSEKLKVSDK